MMMEVRMRKIWWVLAVTTTMMMMMIASSDAFAGVPSSHLAQQQLSFRNTSLNHDMKNKIIITASSQHWNGKKSALFFGKRSSFNESGDRRRHRWWLMKKGNNNVTKLTHSFQKLWKLVGMMAIVWNFSIFHNSVPKVAHASSTTTTTMMMVSRGGSTTTAKMEQRLIDKYVRNYMFNDDVYDPIESTYREIIADSSNNNNEEPSYSKQLSDSVSQVLGKSAAATITVTAGSGADKNSQLKNGLVKTTTNLVNLLTDKLNLPSGLAYLIVSGIVFGTPLLSVAIFGLMFSRAQRSMTDRMAADRYGADNVDLDATERIEEDDDDDDDDDYERDNDDDDDDSYDTEDESDDE